MYSKTLENSARCTGYYCVYIGYRAVHKKVREVHHLKVPRDVVYAAMTDLDPEGLKARGGVGEPKKPKRNRRFRVEVCRVFLGSLGGGKSTFSQFLQCLEFPIPNSQFFEISQLFATIVLLIVSLFLFFPN